MSGMTSLRADWKNEYAACKSLVVKSNLVIVTASIISALLHLFSYLNVICIQPFKFKERLWVSIITCKLQNGIMMTLSGQN